MSKIPSYRLCVSLILIGLITLISSCKATDSAAKMTDKAGFDRLVGQLENQVYRIDVDAVLPFNTAATVQVLNRLLVPGTGNSASRIMVHGAGHYIEIQGNIIKASLPYFGERRQSANSYGKANVGIQIDGTMKDYELLPNETKNRVLIKLKADDSNNGVERYDIVIMSFPGGYVNVDVFSTHRTSIRYTGTLTAIEEEKLANGH